MDSYTVQDGDFTITTDKSLIGIPKLLECLQAEHPSHQDLTLEFLLRSIRHSTMFVVLDQEQDIGAYTRVVTDYATFAYFADFTVFAQYRGRGLGLALAKAITNHPELQSVSRFMLDTKEPAQMYQRLGFFPVRSDKNILERNGSR